jgi:uncharacterized damage-inducible protein DinB
MKFVTTAIILFLVFVKTHAQGSNDKTTRDLFSQEIVKAWEKHSSFNLLILGSLSDEHLKDVSASRGRNVGEQFAHIHETRLNWIMNIDPDVAKNLRQIPLDKISIAFLKENLISSSEAIKNVLFKGLKEGKLDGYQGSTINFYSYLVSHESHHRGQILLSLKQSGHEAKPQVSYGLWNWQD